VPSFHTTTVLERLKVMGSAWRRTNGLFHFGACPTCDQGRLWAVKRLDVSSLMLCCDECYAAWDHPDKVGKYGEGFSGLNVTCDDATQEEIEAVGWTGLESTGWPILGDE